MKNIVKFFPVLFLMTLGSSAFAQEVYTITKSEFERLQDSPEKMEEIKSQGMVIKVVENEPAKVLKQQDVIVTQSELAEYKNDRAKYASFMEDCGGKFTVVADPVKVEPSSVTLSAEDLQKMELEKQLESSKKTEDFVPMRERSGNDLSTKSSTRSMSPDHGSGMGGNASDISEEVISNPVSTKLTKEERYEANRKFDTKAPN